MAIAYVGGYDSTGSANPDGSGLTFSLSGTGAAAGNVAIACYYSRNSTKTVTSVSGVTQVTNNYTSTANGGMIWVGYRVLNATDISNGYFGSYTLNSVSNGTAGYTVVVFSGVDTTTPISAQATPTTGSGVSPNPPNLSITSGDTVLAICGKMDDAAGTFTAPTNYTITSAVQWWSSTSGNDACSGIAYRLAVSATSEDPGTFTTGDGDISTPYWYATTIALKPASAGAATANYVSRTATLYQPSSSATYSATANLATSTATGYNASAAQAPEAVANYVERTPALYQPSSSAVYSATANFVSRTATVLQADPTYDYISIERKTGSGGTYAEVQVAEWGDSPWVDNEEFVVDTTYYYRARRTTQAGTSDYSNEEDVLFQSNEAVANFVSRSASLYEPTGSIGAMSATANYVERTPVIYQPSSSAVYSATANFISRAPVVYQSDATVAVLANVIPLTATPYQATASAAYSAVANHGARSPTPYEAAAAATYSATANLVPHEPATYEASGSIGAMSASANFISRSATVYEPAASAAGETAYAELVSRAPSLYEPTASIGPMSATAEFVSRSATLYEASTASAAVSYANFASRSATAYEPAASAVYSATANFVSRSPSVYQATASIGPMVAYATFTMTAMGPFNATGSIGPMSATANLASRSAAVYNAAGSSSDAGAATANFVSRTATVNEAALWYGDGIVIEMREGEAGEWDPLDPIAWYHGSVGISSGSFDSGEVWYFRARRYNIVAGEPVYSDYSNTDDVFYVLGAGAEVVSSPPAVYEAEGSVADAIRIERKIGVDGVYEEVHYGDWDDASWADTYDFDNGVAYYYRATRITSGEWSSYSNVEIVIFSGGDWDVVINGDSTITNNDWQQSASANFIERTATVYSAIQYATPALFVERTATVYPASTYAYAEAEALAVLVDHESAVYTPSPAGRESVVYGGIDYANDPRPVITRVRVVPPADVESAIIRVRRIR